MVAQYLCMHLATLKIIIIKLMLKPFIAHNQEFIIYIFQDTFLKGTASSTASTPYSVLYKLWLHIGVGAAPAGQAMA